jgi:predicted transcriptional regulator
MTLRQIGDIERGTVDPRASVLTAIEEAFNRAGVIFLEVGDVRGGGRGVRLR